MNCMVNTAPALQLKTNKGLLKFILFSILTIGIYPLAIMSAVSDDINIVASRYDGKKTMNYCLMLFAFSAITLGIMSHVWYHKISNRIGGELKRRGIDYKLSAAHYWLWYILGGFIIVGPFIYMFKLFKAVNKMNEHYNIYG